MAGTQDIEFQELNFIFKSLGERGKEIGGLSRLILKHHSELFKKLSPSDTIFEPYGSAAEDLMCYDPDYPGDVDFMIFPNSEDLMMHVEHIEYLPDHPLHVRIKGVDHPVLQSCLVENTEYVATSALKNFHSAIYGNSSLNLADCLTRTLQLIASREEFALSFGHSKTNGASPAVTLMFNDFALNLFDSDPICKDLEELIIKEGQNLSHLQMPSLDPAEWEWLATFLCVVTGSEYSREHAKLFEDSCKRIFEGFILPKISFNAVSGEVSWNRCENVKALIRHLEIRPENENRRKTEFLEMPMSKRRTEINKEMEDKSEQSMNGDQNGSPRQSKRKTEPPAFEQKTELTSKYLPCIPYEGKKEAESLSGISKQLFEHLVRAVTEANEDLSTETKFKDIEEVNAYFHDIMGGIDFVPAFRCRGWPNVAQEWIKRERQWPSPDIVDRIVQEGFHLVVKPPKNGGNPDCDFRISFSHAEYLLSQEMNDIQRDCYRCLKKYYRAYLSKEPKGLVTFHLKNILLRTIEETGVEVWTESNRAECMMKLLENLLESLIKKDLPHFFVRSYNLFSVDYIESPQILEPLAEIAEKIVKNPVQCTNELIINQELSKRVKKETDSECITSNRSTSAVTTATGQGQKEMEQIPPTDSNDAEIEQMEAQHQGSSLRTSYRYHDLKDIFLATSKELVNAAFNETGCRLEALESLERALVEDIREIARNHYVHVEEFKEIFETGWDVVYCKVWLSTESNMRLRMLDGIKGVVEIWKFMVRQDKCALGEEGASVLGRVLGRTGGDPFDFSHVMPADMGMQMCLRIFNSLKWKPVQLQKVDMDDIALD